MPDPDRPLDGLLVVSVEQAVAAPVCTARLVDAGARVIKIERAEGDFARNYDRAGGADSSYFAWANHGKESLVLDIKAPDDAALLHRIIGQADVFVQNLAPGALERAGFGSAALRSANPRLITCDISGYGERPDLAAKKAYDLLVQAESGLVSVSGGPGELGRIGVSVCDIGTGLAAHAAILEALIARGISGEGRGLALSLFDVTAEWMTVPLLQHEFGAGAPGRVGLRHPTIAPYGAYATGDDQLTLLSIQNEREWVRLCEDVLEQPDLAVDPRFDANVRRVEHRDDLEAAIGAVVERFDADEFRRRLAAASIAYGAINDLPGLAAHPALRRRTVTTSDGGEVTMPAHPMRVADTTEPTTQRVPTIGEHTATIRAEFS